MMATKEDPDLITVAEAARLRGVIPDSIRKLIARGRLRSVTRYGKMLVYRQDILDFEKKQPGPPKKKKKAR